MLISRRSTHCRSSSAHRDLPRLHVVCHGPRHRHDQLSVLALGSRGLDSEPVRGRAGRSTPCGRSTCRRGWWVARRSRGLAASNSPASAVASASRCHRRLLEHSLSLVKPSKLSLQSPVWPSRVGRQRRSRHQSPCAPPPNGREGSLPRPRLDCIHAHPPPGRP